MGTTDEQRAFLFNLPIAIEISLGQLACLDAYIRLGLKHPLSQGASAQMMRDFANTALEELVDRGFYSQEDADEIRKKEETSCLTLPQSKN